MREIKFRVWDNHSSVQGYLDSDSVFLIADGGYLVDDVGENIDMSTTIIEFYTGLKDKNGVEIYEGDIICQQMRFVETNGMIFWQEDKARFAVNLDGFITTITKPQEHSYEVIGNIHEDAELLEEE